MGEDVFTLLEKKDDQAETQNSENSEATASAQAAQTPVSTVSVPVNPVAISQVQSRRGGARPGAGRPKSDGSPATPRAKKTKEPEAPPIPTIDPATLALLKGQLVESYQLALSLLAFAPVIFNEQEKPAVGEGLYYCIETYLPEGFTKHAPAFVLAAVSLAAISRARNEKAARNLNQDKKK